MNLVGCIGVKESRPRRYDSSCARSLYAPLYARAAKDNRASIRVLEKCGFGKDRFTDASGLELEEFLLKLSG